MQRPPLRSHSGVKVTEIGFDGHVTATTAATVVASITGSWTTAVVGRFMWPLDGRTSESHEPQHREIVVVFVYVNINCGWSKSWSLCIGAAFKGRPFPLSNGVACS